MVITSSELPAEEAHLFIQLISNSLCQEAAGIVTPNLCGSTVDRSIINTNFGVLFCTVVPALFFAMLYRVDAPSLAKERIEPLKAGNGFFTTGIGDQADGTWDSNSGGEYLLVASSINPTLVAFPWHAFHSCFKLLVNRLSDKWVEDERFMG